MNLLKLHSWSLVAVLVALQAPSILGANASTHKKPRVDRQIEDFEKNTANGGKLRVIVQPDSTSSLPILIKALKAHGIRISRQHNRIGRLSLVIPASDLSWLENLAGVGSVAVDAPVANSPLADFSGGVSADSLTGLSGEPVEGNELRALLGLTNDPHRGAGVTVAVIDSGIAPTPDLADRIVGFYDFTNGQAGVATAPVDGYGHGTHVAGLVAGSGALSNGQYEGVAPDAHLIGLRVLDNGGSGSTSDVIAAVEFATANKAALGIDVINMSLGHPPFESADTDPLVQAVQAATQAGIIVVVSSGNAGINPTTHQVGYAGVLSPGNAPSALTIASAKPMGTVDPTDDLVANYSSRGPTWIDGYQKPDFTVPGQMVVAPFAPGSFLGTTYPALLVPDANGNNTYIALSGTSMAAGVESGLVALVLEANREGRINPAAPDLTANAIKAFMEYTAFPMHDAAGSVYDTLSQGAGHVNGQAVVQLAASVDTSVPVGSPWLTGAMVPYSTYAGVTIPWGGNILWGGSLVAGESLVWGANAVWAENIVWGQNIVWAENIVWSENIVWGENVVWGENIVWGENVVWGENIVWGENVVWGESALPAEAKAYAARPKHGHRNLSHGLRVTNSRKSSK